LPNRGQSSRTPTTLAALFPSASMRAKIIGAMYKITSLHRQVDAVTTLDLLVETSRSRQPLVQVQMDEAVDGFVVRSLQDFTNGHTPDPVDDFSYVGLTTNINAWCDQNPAACAQGVSIRMHMQVPCRQQGGGALRRILNNIFTTAAPAVPVPRWHQPDPHWNVIVRIDVAGLDDTGSAEQVVVNLRPFQNPGEIDEIDSADNSEDGSEDELFEFFGEEPAFEAAARVGASRMINTGYKLNRNVIWKHPRTGRVFTRHRTRNGTMRPNYLH
jgi:hypothetical protein